MRERPAWTPRIDTPIRLAARRLIVPVLMLVSLLLIVLGKADVLLFERARIAAVEIMAPVLAAVAAPAASVAAGVHRVQGLLDIEGENRRLREDNARLLQWQEAARRLAGENAQLRALTHFQPQGATFSITAQIIGNSGGAFARNVLVNTGARDGVARGQAGVTGEGLVGRVAEVGERTARILLLTDLNSRLPVVVGPSRQRAVLAGDNSDRPLLLYLPAENTAKIGDRIVTGGAEGVFPPELPVGTVASIEGDTIRVEPYAELARFDYVRIVDLGLSAFLPQSAVPQTKPAKIGKPAAGASPFPR